MKKENHENIIGLIGGTSWVSTAEYYRLINEKTNEKLGGLNFARCILYSLNYGDVNELNNRNELNGVYLLILDAAKRLHSAGAGCLVLCANTMHQYADALEREIPLPLIHIADATAEAIKSDKYTTVGLLGTRQTMEMDFYTKKLRDHGIRTIVPEEADREFIEKTIRTELVSGIITAESNKRFLEIITNLHNLGAQGVVLGCTEIPLLVKQEQTKVKLYNTLEIHAGTAVDFYLSNLAKSFNL